MTEPNLRFLQAVEPDHRQQFLTVIDRLILTAYRRANRIEDVELTVREALDDVQVMSDEDTDLGRVYRKWASEALNPTFKSLKKVIETIAKDDSADLLIEAARAAQDFKHQLSAVRQIFPAKNFFSVNPSKRDEELSALLSQIGVSFQDLNDFQSAEHVLNRATSQIIHAAKLPDLIYFGFLIGNAFETGRFGSHVDHNTTLAALAYSTAGWAAQRVGNSTWAKISLERIAKLEKVCTDPAIIILRLFLSSHCENVFGFENSDNSFALEAHAIAQNSGSSHFTNDLLESGKIYDNAADECAIRGLPLGQKVALANEITVGDLFEIGCDKSDKQNDPTNWIGIRLRYAYRLALADQEKRALSLLQEAEDEASSLGLINFETNLNLVKGALLRKQSPQQASLYYRDASEAALVAGDLFRAKRMALKQRQDLGA